MAELFRYIEQAFVTPSDNQAIDVGRQSDLQDGLRNAVSQRLPRDRLRNMARAFIAQHFPSRFDDPFQLGQQLRCFRDRLAHPPCAIDGIDGIDQLIATTFDKDASELVDSDAFLADKALLDDTLVAVKIATGFDRVNARELVALRQVIAFIEDVASGAVAHGAAVATRAALRRPIRIPGEFLYPVTASAADQPPPTPEPPEPPDDSSAQQYASLLAEQQHFKRAYEMIMSLPPDQFEMKSESTRSREVPGCDGQAYERDEASAPPSFLVLPDAAIERLGVDVKQTLANAKIDFGSAPVSHVITQIKRQWQEVSEQLAAYQAPVPARIFRLGAHLFAVQDGAAPIATGRGITQ